jgi:hypothetical protein
MRAVRSWRERSDDIDLNSWWALLYRRTNQAVRRLWYRRINPQGDSRIWMEITRIATKDLKVPLTVEERNEMNRLHWRRGSGSVYRWTDPQAAVQKRLAHEIIEKILAEERAALSEPQPERSVSSEDTVTP